MTVLLFFVSGVVAWTLSSVAVGGISLILAEATILIGSTRAIAPVVSVTSLIAAAVRRLLGQRDFSERALQFFPATPQWHGTSMERSYES